jgi:hypothetical protein
MPHLDYFVLDVFTDTRLAGNPLAVVMNTCGLAAERMQAIAREINLSESTFVERRVPAVERTEGLGICARVWRWAGPAIFSCRRKRNPRGSGMCAWRAAPFLWQKDSFSCRDAHAFNRYSSSQVTASVGSSHFPLVTRGFSVRSSPVFPSFHGPPGHVRFRFVTEHFRGAFLGEFAAAPKR